MKNIFLLIGFSSIFASCAGKGAVRSPANCSSTCEMDFNGDKLQDISCIVTTNNRRELIVFLKIGETYQPFMLAENLSPISRMTCNSGKTVAETVAGKGDNKKKTYKTSGAYIHLYEPEGASMAYFWSGTRFKNIWTSD